MACSLLLCCGLLGSLLLSCQLCGLLRSKLGCRHALGFLSCSLLALCRHPCRFDALRLQASCLLLLLCLPQSFLALGFHAQGILARLLLGQQLLAQHLGALLFQAYGFLLLRCLACGFQAGGLLLGGGDQSRLLSRRFQAGCL